MRTAVVEQAHLGGICLNWGCIPTKALLRSAEIFHEVGEAASFGVVVPGAPTLDLKVMLERSRDVARELNTGVGFLLKKNGVDVIWGTAKLRGGGAIEVAAPAPSGRTNPEPPKDARGPGRYTRRAHHHRHRRPAARRCPGMEPDGQSIWTYFEAMLPPALPRSLLIAGSGAIGIEFASFYRALGVEVTVVELLPEILPAEDAEIAALARKAFEKAGHSHPHRRQGRRGESAARTASPRRIELADGKRESIAAERMISAVGVVGNVDGLGLEALGVKLEQGLIVADGVGRTGVPGIYAIGDVAGPPMLAHKAEHEGVICVEAIKGLDAHPLDKLRVPGCTYSRPQIASVGPDRGARQGRRPRAARRSISISRQRQGAGARRAGRPRQDDLRRQDRRADRRAHDRRRGDRADPGLRHRHAARGDRGGPDAHRLPTPDAFGDDGRKRVGGVRAGAAHSAHRRRRRKASG